jgi:plastocyanin
MTTDTPPPDENADTGEAAEATPAETSDAAPAEPAPAEPAPAEPAEPAAAQPEPAATATPTAEADRSVPFWQRPYVERYLVPLVLPLAVIVGLVMFILNISRIFLSTHGDIDVIIGVGILLTILVGAAILSAAPRMRSSSLALIVAGFVATIILGGSMSIGSSEQKAEGGGLPAEGAASQSLDFESSNALVFTPDAAQAATGIVRITLTDASGEHTFHFEDPKTLLDTLHVTNTGDKVSGRAYFGAAGKYVFYCTIPGHREAGMEGAITVAGPAITLADAEARAKAAPASGGAGGATPTSGAGGATTTSTP